PMHTIPITPDEVNRLVALLGPEYREVALPRLVTTRPAQRCPHCGKGTEFVDWIYTALERGIHSPEFLIESLRDGTSPKKFVHDV
ncbi:hypothetical protein C8Q79DRAFT_872556, partial [Trametes meyenii]